VVSAVSPPFREGLVDRYIVAADAAGIEPVLVLNKIDKAVSPEFLERLRAIHPGAIFISALHKRGMDDLKKAILAVAGKRRGVPGVYEELPAD
jgi:ribosome biogenesis GTPase